MALLRSLGQGICREIHWSFGVCHERHHSVGSVTGVIICWSTISCRVFASFSTFNGTFILACLTGRIKGSRWIVYIPGILPVVSNDFGKAFLREIISHTSWRVISGVEWSLKRPRVAMVMKRGDLLHLIILEKGDLWNGLVMVEWT